MRACFWTSALLALVSVVGAMLLTRAESNLNAVVLTLGEGRTFVGGKGGTGTFPPPVANCYKYGTVTCWVPTNPCNDFSGDGPCINVPGTLWWVCKTHSSTQNVPFNNRDPVDAQGAPGQKSYMQYESERCAQTKLCDLQDCYWDGTLHTWLCVTEPNVTDEWYRQMYILQGDDCNTGA